jgi:lactoylglutathione lyase
LYLRKIIELETLISMRHISCIVLLFCFSLSSAQTRKASLNHVAIYVVNAKTSANFYQQIIGLDTIPEPFHDGKHFWLSVGPGASMHIIEGAPAKKEYYKNQHTCFSVASVEVFVETLKKRNIAFEDRDGKKSAVTIRVDGVKQLWLQDPDGYWVEINDAKE